MKYFNVCLPLLTIYGAGILMLILMRYIFPNMNIFLLTIIATIIITLFECGCGMMSLKYNGHKTWNYGKNNFCYGYIHPYVSAGWFVLIFIFYILFDRIKKRSI